jgi:hypothetical protein
MDSTLEWTRSTFCADSNCVEISISDHNVYMRDGKNLEAPVLQFSRSEWDDFRIAVAAGEFSFE